MVQCCAICLSLWKNLCMHHCRSDGAKDQVDIRGMRGLWQQTLLDEGVVDARLKRTTLAEQLGAVAAAGLVPSELKVICLGVSANTVCIRMCDCAAHIMASEDAQLAVLDARRRCSCSQTAYSPLPPSSPLTRRYRQNSYGAVRVLWWM
jgi:hypothetical protein